MSIAQFVVTLCKFLELEHHNVLDHRIEPPCAIISACGLDGKFITVFLVRKSGKPVVFLEMTGNSSPL
jgi:hypothetical protein